MSSLSAVDIDSDPAQDSQPAGMPPAILNRLLQIMKTISLRNKRFHTVLWMPPANGYRAISQAFIRVRLLRGSRGNA